MKFDNICIMERLPTEIVVDIISRVGANSIRDLFRCKLRYER